MLGFLIGNKIRKKSKKMRRLPKPDMPKALRLELSDAEYEAIYTAAYKCRLSVASMCRVMLIESGQNITRVPDWKAIAESIAAKVDPAKKPGRKKKID